MPSSGRGQVRLDLTYRTSYHYTPAIHGGVTALRLRPISRPGLNVISSSLTASPGRVVSSYRDGWDSHVDLVEIRGLHEVAVFEAQATVETVFGEADLPPTAREWELYRADSARVRRQAVVPLGWHVGGEGGAWQAVESALQFIPQRFIYQVGATDAGTPIESVIEAGFGVCQDFAHVFLSILRSWGWCARYISGYLFSAELGEANASAEAMHAWVEVYRHGAGWIGLDPTAGKYADERYIVVGHGRDYDDVRPVRGVIVGATAQTQLTSLTMQVAQQQ